MKLISQPWGPYPSLEAQIPTSRLKSQPWCSNPSLKAQITTWGLQSQPQGSHPYLKPLIPAFRLKSHRIGSNPIYPYIPLQSSLEPQNLLSIGHLPLQGRCPSLHYAFTYTHIEAMGADGHLKLLLLFFCVFERLEPTAPAQIPKWSSISVPPHKTKVAVYTTLLSQNRSTSNKGLQYG